MNSSPKDWTVESLGFSGLEVGSAEPIDGLHELFSRTERMACVLKCRHSTGFTIEVAGEMARPEAGPLVLESIATITIGGAGAPTAKVFKTLRIGGLYRAIEAHFRAMADEAPEFFGLARALPSPGAAGLPDYHYAVWVKRYLDTVEKHGRGYMRHLLVEHQGETRSNILRKIDRAAALGLYVKHNTPGKVGAGVMTDKCRALLSKGSPS